MKQAKAFNEIRAAVDFNIPVGPQDAFFTEFSDVRGTYYESQIYSTLFVDPFTFEYSNTNPLSRILLFVAGHRGSGKSSEILKWVEKINNHNCYFCVICNVDKELDLGTVEYVDVLTFQLEKLLDRLNQENIKVDDTIISIMNSWFTETVREINEKSEDKIDIESGVEAKVGVLSLLNIFAKLRASVSSSNQRSEVVRTTMKNRFSDFSDKFNLFVADVKHELQQQGKARDVLFIIDGLEKSWSTETRRKIIIEESNRIQQIVANTLFTLPIELMKEEPKLIKFGKVKSFPFVKLINSDNTFNEKAISRFEEFVYKRISPELFDKPETVRKAIMFGGGSPRELLRILEYASMYSVTGKIDEEALDKGIKDLSSVMARHLSPADFKLLKDLLEMNKKSEPVPFLDGIQELLENLIVFEYNDGSHKRVNPVVEASELYQFYVAR